MLHLIKRKGHWVLCRDGEREDCDFWTCLVDCESTALLFTYKVPYHSRHWDTGVITRKPPMDPADYQRLVELVQQNPRMIPGFDGHPLFLGTKVAGIVLGEVQGMKASTPNLLVEALLAEVASLTRSVDAPPGSQVGDQYIVVRDGGRLVLARVNAVPRVTTNPG